ncbi:MAG: DUF4340 domain-containing protein [Sedimentisphaerales bacterium]|nr:DUF4340 domain-containing protein [Sedimentisphaerales bacterium]
MSNYKLFILAVIAIISIISAVAVHQITNKPKQAPAGSVYLIQGLEPAKIHQIIVKANDQKVTLQRREEHFVVTDKDNYPANAERINELVTGTLDIQSVDLQTADEQNYSELGVTEADAENIVEFLDKDGNLITGLIFGKRTEDGGSYVRLINGKEVYLCRNIPFIRSSAIDYIKQQLAQVNKEDIISVTVTDTNGVSYTLESAPGSSEITLAGGLPQGKKLGSEHQQVFSALTGLRFDDVMSEKSASDNLILDSTYICKLKDSTVYILKIAQVEDKTYAQCTASFTNTQQVTLDPSKKESDEELKKKEKILLGRQAVQEFNNTCKGWVYEIPSWKADDLTKPLNDILEDTEEQKTEITDADEL